MKLKHLRRERDGRIYVRRNGRCVRLHQPPGTDAFYLEYAEAVKALGVEPERPSRHLDPSSFAWLVQAYLNSPEFQLRASSTRKRARRILLGLADTHGDKPFRRLEERHVRAMRDEKASVPASANDHVKVLRALFRWAQRADHRSDNPAAGVEPLRYQSGGYHTWTPEEVTRYRERWPSGTRQRLALALLLYTGARRSDVVRLGRGSLRGEPGAYHLVFQTKKTGTVVELPVLPELEAELRANGALDADTFLRTAYGKAFTAAGFGLRFREWCDKAGLSGCSAHGLRKAGASLAAERGATEAQLNAIFGWADGSGEAAAYTRAARRKLMADQGLRLLGERETVPDGTGSGSGGCPEDGNASENKGEGEAVAPRTGVRRSR